MKFLNCCIEEFLQKARNKRIVFVGASKYIWIFCKENNCCHLLDSALCIIDNDVNIHYKIKEVGEYSIVVKPISEVCGLKDIIIIVATMNVLNTLELVEQLSYMELDDSIQCFSFYLMQHFQKKYDNSVVEQTEKQYPFINKKLIHYFWFGHNKKSEKVIECIDSWKRFCPDYQIIEWNENNYDVAKNQYMLQAYESKKWAFVSDVARFDVIYHYGGIYLDTDVEILKNIDNLLRYKAFFVFEPGNLINPGGGFGAVKGNTVIKELLDMYETEEFKCNAGKIDFNIALPQPQRITPYFVKMGLQRDGNSQLIKDTMFFSQDYFRVIEDPTHSNRALRGTEYALHWHDASWFDQETLNERQKLSDAQKRLIDIFST